MFGSRKTQSTPASQSTTPQPSAQIGQPTPTPTAPQKEVRQTVGTETVLGSNAIFKGELTSHANVRIDGTFEGQIDIEGNLMVGETARIVANINAHNMRVAGAVRGNLNGNKVELLRTGRVWGDVSASAITTEEGAFMEGKITMVGHPAGKQGFSGSLPAPEVSILQPIAEDAVSGEPVEAELVSDDKPKTDNDK